MDQRGGAAGRALRRATATRRWAPCRASLRLTGGAARSQALSRVLSVATGASLRMSAREEAGAAGAAMMAAVVIYAYPTMEACIAEWVMPLLGPPEPPDPALARTYDHLFASYAEARRALQPVSDRMAGGQRPAAGTKAGSSGAGSSDIAAAAARTSGSKTDA